MIKFANKEQMQIITIVSGGDETSVPMGYDPYRNEVIIGNFNSWMEWWLIPLFYEHETIHKVLLEKHGYTISESFDKIFWFMLARGFMGSLIE